MDAIYSWIKGIAFYIILVMAIQNVVPNNKYKKYIKIFTGMILVLLIITPITNVFGYTDKISNLFEGKVLEQDLNEMNIQLSGMESSVYDATLNQYKESIKEQVNSFVEEEDMVMESFSCEVDNSSEEIMLSNITIGISKEVTNAENINVNKIKISSKNESDVSKETDISVINIKKSIVDFYNISDDNINISIR